MNRRLSKTIIRNAAHRESDYQKHTKIYSIYSEKGIVGSLWHGPEKSLGPFVGGKKNDRILGRFIEVGGKKYEVENRSPFFKSLVEMESGAAKGSFHFPLLSGLFGFCPKIKIGNDDQAAFKFKLINQVNLFKKETWGAYRFELSDGPREAVFSFKIDWPLQFDVLFYKSNPLPMVPFSGKIEANFDNDLLLLAACFLIEERLVEVQEQPQGE